MALWFVHMDHPGQPEVASLGDLRGKDEISTLNLFKYTLSNITL